MTHSQVRPSDEAKPSDNFYVVGIGASAGGLQPLERFFESLPVDTGGCFVVVQHLSPEFKSLMKELLERRTKMSVYKVKEQMRPRANAVYLIPPGQNLTIRDREFHLVSQARDAASPVPHYPIDLFFQSLAEDCGDRAMGVVLSGTGTDGTRGLQAINESGGLTFVQAPETAEFDGMPNTAISTRIIDQILPPRELAQTIAQLLQSPQTIPAIQTDLALQTENALSREAVPILEQIVRILAEQEKVNFSFYKENTLSRRIQRRCIALGFQSLLDYVHHLQQSEEERLMLKSDLLIKVTYFFRNAEAWRFLEKQILPGLIDIMEPDNPLRLWCAACATGEEAYSLAILLHELADQAGRPVHAKIFATDLDQSALDQASSGLYPDVIRNDVPERLLEKYFQVKDEGFEINRKLREMVIFANHNLVQDAGFTRLHFVSCRNVLIYMQSQLQQKVIRALNFALRPNGILFLGESENLGELESAFTTLSQRWKIYRKFRATSLVEFPRVSRDTLFSSRTALKSPARSALDPILEGTLRSLVERRGATCLVIDRHNCLVHVAGGSSDILQLPEGRLTSEVTERVVPSLKLPLTTALNRARRSGPEGASYRGIPLRELDTPRLIKLEVWIQPGGTSVGDYAIALIESDDSLAELAPERPPLFEVGEETNQRIQEVENELRQTRENLQATIEELETTNEEQQATNEELIASNEELQSTNEELHSVNEELYTVNSEYQAKIQELLELNSDIDNLLESTDIGVVFLDRSLAVRKFTPAAQLVFRLVKSDLGRPIGDLVNDLELDDFEGLVREVLDSGTPQNHEVKLRNKRDRHILIRLHPYYSAAKVQDGIVISLVDISRLKTAEQDLLEAQAQLEVSYGDMEEKVWQRTRVLQSFSNHLRHLHQVSTRSYDSLFEQLQEYLELGRSIFNLSGTSLLCVENEAWVLKVSVPSTLTLDWGRMPASPADYSWLPWSIGDKTIGQTDAASLDFDSHPLYREIPVRTYLATRLHLDGQCIGVLEFVDGAVREQPFEQQDFELLGLIATGVANAVARFQARQTLLQRESKYRKLYHDTPVMLHSIDARGRLISVSDYWLQKLGYERTEVLGRQSTEFLTEESRAYAEQVVLPAYYRAGNCHDIPYQFVRKDGEVIDVLLSATAERDDEDQVIRSLVVSVDVTESRRLQVELEQAQTLAKARETADVANRAKSRFLASISHELRTPLNSILGFTELLGRDQSLGEEQQEQIAIVRRGGQHLLSLINNVLDISKIEAEQLVLIQGHFDLDALLQKDIWGLFHHQAATKQLKFEVIKDESVPRYIYTDAMRVRQIVTNLVSNAIKFTERGHVRLQATAVPILQPSNAESAPSQQRLRFAISDTGPGINAEQLSQIFDAFTQAGDLDNVRGAGLGLHISQQLANLLEGEIAVESQVGVGSTFTLTLPVQLSDEAKATVLPEGQEILGLVPGQGPYRILILADDPDNQRFLDMLLRQTGFDCRAVDSIQTALQSCSLWQPDVVLVDVRLPKAEGKRLVQQFRVEADAIKIVMLTADTSKQKQAELLTTGCDAHLKKPATITQVLKTLQQLLQVEYRYQEATEVSSPFDSTQTMALGLSPLAVAQLQQLPQVWLAEFQNALMTGAANQMYELIDQLPTEVSEAALALESQVSRYRFQALLDLFAPLCETLDS